MLQPFLLDLWVQASISVKKTFLFLLETTVETPHVYVFENRCAYSLSCVQLFATPQTVVRQAPLFMEFSRQECWSGLPCPSPGDLPYPGIEPGSPTLQADSLPSEPPGQLFESRALCKSFLILTSEVGNYHWWLGLPVKMNTCWSLYWMAEYIASITEQMQGNL